MKKLLVALSCLAIFACKNDAKKSGNTNDVASSETSTLSTTNNPANETEANIYRSINAMMKAFKDRDWKTFGRYNHPAMIKMMGGEQSFEKMVSEQMKQIPDTSIKVMEAGKILQVVKTPSDQQCVIEQNMVMNTNGYQVTSTTYLIGESLDGGQEWTFFDGSAGGPLKPKDVKPNLSGELKIPEKKQDVKQL